MSKPFFYRITAADFLAAVVTVPEADRGQWALDLALDMVSADIDTAKSEFAKSIIVEATEFRTRKANAGAKGGKAKASSAKAVLSSDVAEPSTPLARSSNRSSTVTEEPKPFAEKKNLDTIKEIIDYLNAKAGKNFKSSTPATIKMMSARIKEGYTLEDFKAAVDNQVASWSGTEYEEYLRPATLFQPGKMDGYVNNTGSNKKTVSKTFNYPEF